MRSSSLVVPLAACIADDADTDTDLPADTDLTSGQTEETEETEAPVTYRPTWAGVQRLFDESCDGCHPTSQGIDLHHDVRFPPGDPYVVPFEPESSYLWGAVTGKYPLGEMPPTGLLPRETVQCIEDWILAGALFD